jgi:hypothetical protein
MRLLFLQVACSSHRKILDRHSRRLTWLCHISQQDMSVGRPHSQVRDWRVLEWLGPDRNPLWSTQRRSDYVWNFLNNVTCGIYSRPQTTTGKRCPRRAEISPSDKFYWLAEGINVLKGIPFRIFKGNWKVRLGTVFPSRFALAPFQQRGDHSLGCLPPLIFHLELILTFL